MEKNKFNITDGILILVILAAAAVLVYIVSGTGFTFGGSDEVTIQYTVEMRLVRNEFVPAINKIKTGDKFTDSVRSYDIGDVHQVSISEAFVESTDIEKGIIVLTPYPDHSRVLITVRAKARKDSKDVNYTVNGKIIMVGVQVHFRTPYFMGTGFCIAMEEIKED